MNKPYRHGDVLIVPSELPSSATPVDGLVLAEGESTGHMHQIVSGNAQMFKFDDRMYLKVQSEIAEITHQEHGLKTLARGTYEIKIRKTWSETGWQKVID